MKTAITLLSVLVAIAIGLEIFTYSQYATKRDALLKLEETLAKAERDRERLNKEMSDKSNRVKELMTQVETGKKERAKLKAQSAAVGVLREKMLKANETTAQLKQKLSYLEDRTGALTTELFQVSKERATFEARSADAGVLREKLRKADQETTKLKKKILDLEGRIRVLTEELDAEKKEKEALNNKAIEADELREKLVEANQDIDKLKRRISDLEVQTRALAGQVAAEQEEKVVLEAEAAVADDLQKKLVEANKDADRLRRRVGDLESQTKTLTKQVTLEKKQKEVFKAEAAVADDLQEKLVEANEDADRLRQRISDLEKGMKGLIAEVALERKEKAALRTKVARVTDLQKKLDKLGKNFETVRSHNENLNRELASRNVVIQELKERIAEIHEELDETDRAYTAAEGELALKEQMIEGFEKELENIKSHIPYLKLELEKDKDQIRGMHERVVHLMDEKEKTETELQQMKSTYDSLISDLKNQIDAQEVNIKRYKEKISVSFVDRILFDFGKASISSKGKEILRKVGKTIKRVNNKRIRVVGHTDNVGIQKKYRFKFPSNWELSAARAAAVVRYFQAEVGVEPVMMEAVGRSFYEPIADNDTSEGRAQNRRVIIVIAPNL